MGNNTLTIEIVKELAMENYCKGGDIIVECYEDYQIRDLIDSGINTEEKLLDFFQKQFEIDEEYRKAANWYAYGTTDDEEIAEFLGKTASTEKVYEKFEPYHDEKEYTPSATNGDYSPSNPWDAPGMSIKDFI